MRRRIPPSWASARVRTTSGGRSGEDWSGRSNSPRAVPTGNRGLSNRPVAASSRRRRTRRSNRILKAACTTRRLRAPCPCSERGPLLPGIKAISAGQARLPGQPARLLAAARSGGNAPSPRRWGLGRRRRTRRMPDSGEPACPWPARGNARSLRTPATSASSRHPSPPLTLPPWLSRRRTAAEATAITSRVRDGGPGSRPDGSGRAGSAAASASAGRPAGPT